MAGASAALLVGGAPFDGPAACVRIGRNVETGEFIVNPTYAEQEISDLELTIAGTADYISMVEAGAEEISEEDMLAAMELRPGGHRRVLREAGGVPGQGEPRAHGVHHPRGRSLHRRARGRTYFDAHELPP